eukprot:388119_1
MAGDRHTCVLSTGNKVKCFGDNNNGQLGSYGNTHTIKLNDGNLSMVDLGSNFLTTQIVTGYEHTCALSTTNKVKCWGYNLYGQLGYGDKNNRGDEANEMGDSLSEVDLGSSFIPMRIIAGKDHTCALSTANKVKCFGRNNYGQLGYNDVKPRGNGVLNEMGDALLEIDLGSNFIPMQIMAGDRHTCVLSTGNKVKCFGHNNNGQLGSYGNTLALKLNDGNLSMVDLGSNFLTTQIVTGYEHTCALSSNKTVKYWGYNLYGQLGYGDKNNRGDEANEMGDSLSEVDLGSSFIPMRIVAGKDHTCALSTVNKVKCFGKNNHGQLGYHDVNHRGDGVLNEMGDALLEVDLGSNFI